MDIISIKTEDDSTLMEVSSLLSMLESDDPPSLPFCNSEPVIELPEISKNTSQESDPLDLRNDFRFVSVESLMPSSELEQNTLQAFVTEEIELKSEIGDIEEVLVDEDSDTSSIPSPLPQTRSCSILLDRNEVDTYLCLGPGNFKLSSKKHKSPTQTLVSNDGGKSNSFSCKENMKTHVTTHRNLKSSLYWCLKCNSSFTKPSELKLHEQIKHGEYICKYCSKILKSSCKLQRHISKLHNSQHVKNENYSEDSNPVSDNFEQMCDNPSPVQSDLVNVESSFVKNEHSSNRGKLNYICKTCNDAFKTKLELKKHHISRHTLLNNSIMTCDLCSKHKFNNKNKLKHHIICKHLKNSFHCTICDTRYTLKGFLLKHKNKIHSNIKCKIVGLNLVSIDKNKNLSFATYKKKDEKCPKCSYISSKSIYVKRHLYLKHGEHFNHICKQCFLPFSHARFLDKHIKCKHNKSVTNVAAKIKITKLEPTISLNGNYKCFDCKSVSYINERNLNWHKALKHQEKFEITCEYCLRPFTTKKKLVAHIRLTHKIYKNKFVNINVKKYSCNICKHTFQTKNGMKTHLLKHSLVNSIQCDICKKSNFISKNDVKTHIITKHLKMLYQCTICDAKFKVKGCLVNHKLNIHQGIHCKIVGLQLIINTNRSIDNKNDLKISKVEHSCPKCPYKSCKSIYVKRHLYLKHNEKFENICKYCFLPFTQEHVLNRHVQLKHNKEMMSQSNLAVCKDGKYKNVPCTDISNKTPKVFQSDFKVKCICNYCHKQISNQSNLNRHIKLKHSNETDEHNDSKSFLCKLCKCTFSTLVSFRSHCKIRHELENLYECGICKENYFFHKKDIENHMLTNHLKNAYHCTICNVRFTLKENLLFHKNKIHSSEKCKIIGLNLVRKDELRGTKLSCPKCSYKSAKSIYVKRHLYLKHGKHFEHMCKYCYLPFIKKHTLEKHLKVKHKVDCIENTIEDICANKRRVVNSRHPNYVPHACHICNSKFDSLLNLQKHLITVHSYGNKTSEILYCCNLCNATVDGRINMKNHLQYKHDIQFQIKCYFCKFTTNEDKKINIHIINKHLKLIYENTSTYNIENNYKLCINEVEILSKNYSQKYHEYNNKKNEPLSFLCKTCNLEFKTYAEFKSHNRSHDIGRPYICFQCKYPFKQVSGLQRHLKVCHQVSKSLTCNDCTKKFYFKSSLKNHIKIEHTEKSTCTEDNKIEIENYSYYCLVCNLMLENETSYKSHCNMFHSNKLKCGNCNKEYSTKIDIENHIKENGCSNLRVKKIMKHNCKMCTNKSFKTALQLKSHTMLKHGLVPGTCPYCELHYVRIGQHIARNHLNTYNCTYCNDKFIGIINLKQHINTVHYNEKFKCKYCDMRLLSKLQLSEHVKQIHGIINPHLCHLCGKDYPEKYLLLKHLNSFHEGKTIEKENDKKCPKCNNRYKSLAVLNKHILINHKKFRHKCNLCKFSCKSMCAFKKHEYLKHNIGTFKEYYNKRRNVILDYKCSHCFYSFMTEKVLMNHYNREHVPCFCDICNRKLLGKHSMEKHLEYSHGMKEKVYPCKKCKHVALTPGRLQKHVLAKHKK